LIYLFYYGDLGLHLDSELSMKHHITKVAAVSFYHLRQLREIRRRVGTKVIIRLVLAVMISRLDYCNSVLAGVPRAMLGPLQRVQNAAACLIFKLTPRDHITTGASSIRSAALCTLYKPEDARLI